MKPATIEPRSVPLEFDNANHADQAEAASSPQMPPRVFLRKEEIGPWLGVSDSVIEDWMRDHVIPVIKIKRVRLFNVVSVKQALGRFEAKAVGDVWKV
jgi:hypothetical protein